MPIRISNTCRHCAKPIHQDDYFGDWFHVGKGDAPNDLFCAKAGTTAEPFLTLERPSA